GMKAYATWFTTETLQECREACGGKGYLAENRIADLKADSDIFTTFEGDNTVLMQLVAKGVLTTFKESFHNEGMMGVLRFAGQRFSTSLYEKNPFAIRNTDKEHLLDADFHLAAFKYRENYLTYSVGQRLRGLIKNGRSAYDAFLRCQTQLLALANAFVEVKVLEQFIAKVENAPNQGIKKTLRSLCQLYALHTIESHKGWYLEIGYLDGIKTKAIRRLVDQLCKDVRVDAKELVDAYGIPDGLLAAPIAVTGY
ncbi:MAG: acyl-CoA dehydrogenase, partial [Bacteroidota bacterium]